MIDRQVRLNNLRDLMLGAKIERDSWARLTADHCAIGARNDFVVARYVEAKQRVALLLNLISLETTGRFHGGA